MSFSIGSLTRLPLGMQGESNSRPIRIDVHEWLEDWPGAAVNLMVCRPGEEEYYPANSKVENGILTWVPSRSDVLIAGKGIAQFILTDDNDVEMRSRVVETLIGPSIRGTEGEAPDPAEGWVHEVLQAAQDAQEAVDKMPIIGENGNWLLWNSETSEYVDSGVVADSRLKNIMDGTANGSVRHVSSLQNGATLPDGSGTVYQQGAQSYAFGVGSAAGGIGAAAFGLASQAMGMSSLSAGYNTQASDSTSVAFGMASKASGEASLAVNHNTTASGTASSALGCYTNAAGSEQMAIGRQNIPDAEGKYAFIIGNGDRTTVGDDYKSNAFTVDWEGNGTFAGSVTANGQKLLSNLLDNTANASVRHVNARATGDDYTPGATSFAWGRNAAASGPGSIAWGLLSRASGMYSRAFGTDCEASGTCSTAIGNAAKATGGGAQAQNTYTVAAGENSTAMGVHTYAGGNDQVVMGRQNLHDDAGTYALIVGNGSRDYGSETQEEHHSNALTVDWQGNLWVKGDVFAGGSSMEDAKTAGTIYVTATIGEAYSETYFRCSFDKTGAEVVEAVKAGKTALCLLEDGVINVLPLVSYQDDGSVNYMLQNAGLSVTINQESGNSGTMLIEMPGTIDPTFLVNFPLAAVLINDDPSRGTATVDGGTFAEATEAVANRKRLEMTIYYNQGKLLLPLVFVSDDMMIFESTRATMTWLPDGSATYKINM